MKFEKGNKGKPKGAKNKITQDIRSQFKNLLVNNLEQIQKDLDGIDNPKDRIQVLLGIAKFVLPQLRTIEQINPTPEPIVVDWESISEQL